MNKDELLKEFDIVSEFVTLKGGVFVSILREISNDFSLKMTNILQKTGCNKKIKNINKESIILNIGCGNFTKDDWIDVDLFPSLKFFLQSLIGKYKIKTKYYLNLTVFDKYFENIADGIILSHVIEHIPSKYIKLALKNCYKYLKNYGYIRVSFPYIKCYDKPENIIPEHQKVKNKFLAQNSLIYGWFHKFMYDAEIVIALLEDVGFANVREVSYNDDFLGFSDQPDRKDESLYILAQKIC